MVGALGERDRGLGEVRLGGLAQPVELVETGRELLGTGGIVGHEQVERELGIGHAAGGVEPRCEHEGDVVGR